MPPRVVWCDDVKAPVTHVPFWMWLGRSRAEMGSAVLADDEPEEMFAALCAAAYLGCFDNGYLMEKPTTREERLKMYAGVLPEDRLETVMAVAVPQRYRELSAAELEEMVRTGTAEDRPWAACWLALCGWFDSDDCTLLGNDPDERQERIGHYLQEVITDEEECRRWDNRVGAAAWMYLMNGPPPLGISRPCLGGIRPGWVEMVQLVPARLHADRNPFRQGELFFRRDR